MGNLCATSSRRCTRQVHGGKGDRLLKKLCKTFKEITAPSYDNSDRQVISLKLVKRSVSLVNDSNRQTVKLISLGDDELSSWLKSHILNLKSGADRFLNDLLEHLKELRKETHELFDALERWTTLGDRKDGKEEKKKPRSRWKRFFSWWRKPRGKKVEDEALGKLNRFDSGKKFCEDFQKSLHQLVTQQHLILEEFERQKISKPITKRRFKRVISVILRGFLLAFLIASIVAAVALPLSPLPVVQVSDFFKDMMKLVNSERLASWMDGQWKKNLNDLQLVKNVGDRKNRETVRKEAMLRDLQPLYSSVNELKKLKQEPPNQLGDKEFHQMKKKVQKKLLKARDQIDDSIKAVESCKNDIDRREKNHFFDKVMQGTSEPPMSQVYTSTEMGKIFSEEENSNREENGRGFERKDSSND